MSDLRQDDIVGVHRLLRHAEAGSPTAARRMFLKCAEEASTSARYSGDFNRSLGASHASTMSLQMGACHLLELGIDPCSWTFIGPKQ